jgi:hypothetical protein
VFHPKTHIWTAKATLLDHPRNEAYIAIAEIGSNGKLLFDHYHRVGDKKDVWIPLRELTPDIVVHHQVYVVNGTKK